MTKVWQEAARTRTECRVSRSSPVLTERGSRFSIIDMQARESSASHNDSEPSLAKLSSSTVPVWLQFTATAKPDGHRKSVSLLDMPDKRRRLRRLEAWMLNRKTSSSRLKPAGKKPST